jgi:hypothetical protein
MTRCPICMKRTWFWQVCIASRFGYGHLRCIDARIQREIYEGVTRSIAGACFLWTVRAVTDRSFDSPPSVKDGEYVGWQVPPRQK